MNITNIVIIKDLQYFILSAIVIFALLALFILDIKKKFIFLFFFALFAQIFNFTLYFGELFYLLFIPLILFLVIFYLYNLQIEIYSLKNIYDDKIFAGEDLSTKADKNLLPKGKAGKIYCLAMPILFCGSFIFLFLKFSRNYTAKFNIAKTITLVNFSNIAKEIYLNYGILMFLLILLIFMLFLWIISIILIRKKK